MTRYDDTTIYVNLYIENGKLKHSKEYIRKHNKAKYKRYIRKNKLDVRNKVYSYPVL